MFKLITDHPIAFESPDHLVPHGTMADNSTNPRFIEEVENYFGGKINFLDLGCSGGQLVIDFANRGHKAVGIEGSDYSVKHKRANWPKYHNTNLFTGDICKTFVVKDDAEPMKFDCITAWEVLEHPKPDDVLGLLFNVYQNLKPNGIFCASIALTECGVEGVRLHQTVKSREFWNETLATWFVDVTPCPIKNWVRTEGEMKICVKKKPQDVG